MRENHHPIHGQHLHRDLPPLFVKYARNQKMQSDTLQTIERAWSKTLKTYFAALGGNGRFISGDWSQSGYLTNTATPNRTTKDDYYFFLEAFYTWLPRSDVLTATDRSWLMRDFCGLSEMDLRKAFSGRLPFSASKLRRFRAISPSSLRSKSCLCINCPLSTIYFLLATGRELSLSSNEGAEGSADSADSTGSDREEEEEYVDRRTGAISIAACCSSFWSRSCSIRSTRLDWPAFCANYPLARGMRMMPYASGLLQGGGCVQ